MRVAKVSQEEKIALFCSEAANTLRCESVFTPGVFSTKTQDFTPMFLKFVVEVHLFLKGSRKPKFQAFSSSNFYGRDTQSFAIFFYQ